MDARPTTGETRVPALSGTHPPVTLPGNDSGFVTPGLFTGLLPSSCCLVPTHAAVALADWALVYDLVHLSGDFACKMCAATEHTDLLEVSLPAYGDTRKLPAGDVASSVYDNESNEAP
ncbi:MAG: hypothetical protein M0T79_14925 [Actinomycetota bacterium]|nr:hypothetical protein [Actinomycetota bacterium]